MKKILLILSLVCIQVLVFGQREKEIFYFKQNLAPNLFEKDVISIDSINLYKKYSNDTLTFWTVGMSTPMNEKQIKKLKKNNKIDFSLQLGRTLNDGRRMVYRLRPMKFLLRNDTLFQWTEKYRLSQDSISNLVNKGVDTSMVPSFDDILKSNTDMEFRPFFSTNMVNFQSPKNKIEESDSFCPNQFELDRVWDDGGQRFYEFHITNKCGEWGRRWGFIINEELEFVSFGGYYNHQKSRLNKDNQIF